MTKSSPPTAEEDADDTAPVPHTPLPDDEFKVQLGQVIPHLRAFGRSLSGNRDLADDLVQETLLKAWAARQRFQDEKRHEIGMAFMSQYASALAYDLAQCSPGDLDMVFLGSSGSEAMESGKMRPSW